VAAAVVGKVEGARLAGAANAYDDRTHARNASYDRPSMGDRHFMQDAARGSAAEVELGQLAEQRATSPAVRSFGRMMVDDHQRAADALRDLASRKGMTLPTEPGLEQKALEMRLRHLHGARFDRAYVQAMVNDHRKVADAFAKEARGSGGDPDVKSWADHTLPTIRQHLRHAERLANRTS
jgi:putative membrane protein